MGKAEDSVLIKKILRGNRAAEDALYQRYQQNWGRLCLRYGRNRSEAEDILQEGLILIFKDLHQYKSDKGAFYTWSSRILVNAALRYLKRNHWQQSFEDLELAKSTIDISESALQKISAKELTQLVQKLPSGYRVVFNMYAIEGYSHAEIGQHLGITESASRSQLSKARKLLKKQLSILF